MAGRKEKDHALRKYTCISVLMPEESMQTEKKYLDECFTKKQMSDSPFSMTTGETYTVQLM